MCKIKKYKVLRLECLEDNNWLIMCSFIFYNVPFLINLIYEFVSSIIICVDNICKTHNF